MSDSRQLAQKVTALTAGCVIVSNMIGTGIFGTTGFMARDLGSPVLILLLWVGGGLFALMGAMCYSELGTLMPRAGGDYIYLRETFGPFIGFLSGWMSLTIGFSAAIAANGHLFAAHVSQLLPGQSSGALAGILSAKVIGLLMIWALTLVHLAGVVAGGWLTRGLTVLKVGAILTLIGAGLFVGQGDWANLTQKATTASPGPATLLTSFMFVTFAFSGWNAAGYIAGEMRNPARSIPGAALSATLVVTLLYLGLNLIYLYALPVEQLAGDPIEPVAHNAAAAMFGPGTGWWATLFLCVSIAGATSAMIWAGPRVYFAMAKDGALPAFFSTTHAKSGAPIRSILLQSAWVSVLILVANLEGLILYTAFSLVLFTAMTVSCVLVLRLRQPTQVRPYSVTLYPIVPLLYLLVSAAILWAAFVLQPTKALLGLGTTLVGIPFYFLARRKPA